MIATQIQQDYANVFIAGLLLREEKISTKSFHDIKQPEVKIQSKEEQKITIKLNEPIFLGKTG